ncbi:hypothetical protein FACS189447_07770 [Spirochaetia bacterium]|nr:hypothetical protein FACS189447_07770 [Spirochaetia bacterium]
MAERKRPPKPETSHGPHKIRNGGRGGPCATCRTGDCESCLDSPGNSTPIRLFTPKGAARAMLTGTVLRDERGCACFWEDRGSDGVGFWFIDTKGAVFRLADFSGLYMDL